jgi:hypothetical protein
MRKVWAYFAVVAVLAMGGGVRAQEKPSRAPGCAGLSPQLGKYAHIFRFNRP